MFFVIATQCDHADVHVHHQAKCHPCTFNFTREREAATLGSTLLSPCASLTDPTWLLPCVIHLVNVYTSQHAESFSNFKGNTLRWFGHVEWMRVRDRTRGCMRLRWRDRGGEGDQHCTKFSVNLWKISWHFRKIFDFFTGFFQYFLWQIRRVFWTK